MISDPEIEILCGEYKNSYKEIVNANSAVKVNAKNAKSLNTYKLKCESEISENKLLRKDKFKDNKIEIRENHAPCEKDLYMQQLGLQRIENRNLRSGNNTQEKINSYGNTKNPNNFNDYEKEQFEVRNRVYKDIHNLVREIKNPKLSNFKENNVLYDLIKLSEILKTSRYRKKKLISLEKLSICDRVKIYNKYFGCNFKTSSKDTQIIQTKDQKFQETILSDEGPTQKSPEDPKPNLKRKRETLLNETFCEETKFFDPKVSSSPLKPNDKNIRKINCNKMFKLNSKSVRTNSNVKNSVMRQLSFNISNEKCANKSTKLLEKESEEEKNSSNNSRITNSPIEKQIFKLPLKNLEKINITSNRYLVNIRESNLFDKIDLQNKETNSLTKTHFEESDTDTHDNLTDKLNKDLTNLKLRKLPSNSKRINLRNKLNLRILDNKLKNKKKPTPFIANKPINISKKHVNTIDLSISCTKHLVFKKEQLNSPKLKPTNQRAGQVTREREDIQSDPKTKIQDGRHSRVIERTERSRNKVKRIVNEEMESEDERKRRIETEDELVYDYLTDITLEAVNKERSHRLAMLKRLTEKQRDETRPTRKEAEELLRKEKQRTSEISQAIFVKLQNEKMNRTFYSEISIPDKEGNPEYEVTSIISVRKVKENIASMEKINLNFTIDENEMTVRYGEVEEIVTSDDESEKHSIHSTHDEDKENRDSIIPTSKEKPKVVEDIQIKPPDKKNPEVQILKMIQTTNIPPAKKELYRSLSSRQNSLEGELRPEDKPSTSKTGQEAKSPILTVSKGKVTRIRPEYRESDSDSDWQPVRRRKVAKRSARK